MLVARAEEDMTGGTKNEGAIQSVQDEQWPYLPADHHPLYVLQGVFWSNGN